MNNDKISELITAIDVIAECTREMYKQLIHQGFSDAQALQLTRTWMATTFKPKPYHDEDGVDR